MNLPGSHPKATFPGKVHEPEVKANHSMSTPSLVQGHPSWTDLWISACHPTNMRPGSKKTAHWKKINPIIYIYTWSGWAWVHASIELMWVQHALTTWLQKNGLSLCRIYLAVAKALPEVCDLTHLSPSWSVNEKVQNQRGVIAVVVLIIIGSKVCLETTPFQLYF